MPRTKITKRSTTSFAQALKWARDAKQLGYSVRMTEQMGPRGVRYIVETRRQNPDLVTTAGKLGRWVKAKAVRVRQLGRKLLVDVKR